jgi:hypothetical protein
MLFLCFLFSASMEYPEILQLPFCSIHGRLRILGISWETNGTSVIHLSFIKTLLMSNMTATYISLAGALIHGPIQMP